jgi:hypothetical protein
MDLIDLQKTVALSAVIDESGLQGRVNIVNLGFVNIAFGLGLLQHLHIVFLHCAVLGQDDLNLFLRQDTDKHLPAFFNSHNSLFYPKCAEMKKYSPKIKQPKSGFQRLAGKGHLNGYG